MEKYKLIHAISYKDRVYTFAKGAPPKGYIKEDIKITRKDKIAARTKLGDHKSDALNKEYMSIYWSTKKLNAAYTYDEHRRLHYERIYQREYISK